MVIDFLVDIFVERMTDTSRDLTTQILHIIGKKKEHISVEFSDLGDKVFCLVQSALVFTIFNVLADSAEGFCKLLC